MCVFICGGGGRGDKTCDHHYFHCPVSYCSVQEWRRKAWSILKLGILYTWF